MPANDIVQMKRIEGELREILSPLPVRENFDALWRRMELACRVEEIAAVAAQIYFSMTMYLGLWAEAIDKFWVDPLTNDKYSGVEDAPQDTRARLQWREFRRWSTQEQFITYAKKFQPRATLWNRHGLLMDRIILWRVANGMSDDDEIPSEIFWEFARAVVLAPSLTDTVRTEILDIRRNSFEVRSQKIVDRIAGDRALPPPDAMNYKQEVAKVVLEKLEDTEYTARNSRVATAVKEMRENIVGDPTVSLYLTDIEQGDHVAMRVDYPPEDDGGIVPTEIFKVLFVRESGEIVPYSDLPSGVRKFIAKRWRVMRDYRG